MECTRSQRNVAVAGVLFAGVPRMVRGRLSEWNRVNLRAQSHPPQLPVGSLLSVWNRQEIRNLCNLRSDWVILKEFVGNSKLQSHTRLNMCTMKVTYPKCTPNFSQLFAVNESCRCHVAFARRQQMWNIKGCEQISCMHQIPRKTARCTASTLPPVRGAVKCERTSGYLNLRLCSCMIYIYHIYIYHIYIYHIYI